MATQIDQMNVAVGELNTAVQSGDVEASKVAYGKARPYYERAESAVEGFVLPGFAPEDNAGNLDYLIDMRESTPVDAAVGWSGFHAVERDLFEKGAITASTKDLAAEVSRPPGRG